MTQGIRSLRGEDQMLGPLTPQEHPAALDPAPFQGAFQVREDGNVYFSDGERWRRAADDELLHRLLRDGVIAPTVLEPRTYIDERGTLNIVGTPYVGLEARDYRRFEVTDVDDEGFEDATTYETDADIVEIDDHGFSAGGEVRVRIRDVDEQGTESRWSEEVVIGVAGVRTPQMLAPENDAEQVPLNPVLQATELETRYAPPQYESTEWVVERDTGETVYESGSVQDETEHRVEEILDPESTYVAYVRHTDRRFGTTDWSTPVTFTTAMIKQPEILKPESGAQGLMMPVQCEASELETDIAGAEHVRSRWKVYDHDDKVIYDSGETRQTTEYSISRKLRYKEPGQYSVQVRFEEATLGWSEWSDPVTFFTAFIHTPEITQPEAGADGVHPKATLVSSSLEATHSDAEHTASEWRVIDHDDGETVYDAEGSDLTEHELASALSQGSVYRAQVRHYDSYLEQWSGWSDELFFQTDSVATPSIESPSEGETDVSLEFEAEASEFDAEAIEHVATQFQVKDSDGAEIYKSDELSATTTHTVELDGGYEDAEIRVRYKGDDGRWTSWSDPVTFSTVVVEAPSIEEPSAFDTLKLAFTIETSSFEPEDEDTHVATEYRVVDAEDDTEYLREETESGLTEFEVELDNEVATRDVLIQARHKGEQLGWSEWGDTVEVTIAGVDQPSVTRPFDGSEDVSVTFTAETGDFGVGGFGVDIEDTHVATRWQVKDADSEEVLYDTESEEDLTEHEIAMDEGGRTIEIYARHKGETYGWSEWSEPNVVELESAPEPTIDSPFDGEEDVGRQVTVHSSYNGGDTHIESQYRVLDGDDEVKYDSGELAFDLDEHTVELPGEQKTTFKVQVRHRGDALGWSDYAEVEVTTLGLEAEVELPGFDDPPQIVPPFTATVDVSATDFDFTPQVEETEWELYDDEGEKVATFSASDSEREIEVDDFEPHDVFELRARAKDPEWGWSEWSEKKPFTAVPYAEIKKPEAGTVLAFGLVDFNVETEIHSDELPSAYEWRVTDEDGNTLYDGGDDTGATSFTATFDPAPSIESVSARKYLPEFALGVEGRGYIGDDFLEEVEWRITDEDGETLYSGTVADESFTVPAQESI